MYRTLVVRGLWGRPLVAPVVRRQLPRTTVILGRRFIGIGTAVDDGVAKAAEGENVISQTASTTRTIATTAMTTTISTATTTATPDITQASMPLKASEGLANAPQSPTCTLLPKEGKPKRSLPATCTGCGAFTQTNSPQHPGYFGMERKAVREYLGLEEKREKRPEEIKENHQVLAVINQIGAKKLEQLGIDPKSLILEEDPDLELTNQHDKSTKPPLCDRCHVLIHHNVGESIFHPNVHSLHQTLDETPWKYNHVFHVLDAADFPMSLVPRLHELIGDIRLRSKNRRSQPLLYKNDRSISLSFVITRSDLLAPTKQQVDSLVPYLREVLREALGRVGKSVRLGNLWCVSAKRSWWVQDLREEVWKRRGASWLIGKINVGKSQLFETIYPKGRLPAPKETSKKTSMDEASTDEVTSKYVPGPETTGESSASAESETTVDSSTSIETKTPIESSTESPAPVGSSASETTNGFSNSIEVETPIESSVESSAPVKSSAPAKSETLTDPSTSVHTETPVDSSTSTDSQTPVDSSASAKSQTSVDSVTSSEVESTSTSPPVDPDAPIPLIEELDPLKIGEWLPPARKEEMYPAMPTVSSLAGTTASPIRIPFGGGRGELIDLPGLARTSLTNQVMTKYRHQLIMTSRIVPEQRTVKSGQSLLIGGMFRITPADPDTIILAYNFTPMQEHVTHTQKAIEITEQRSDLFVNNIAVPGVGSSMKCAGTFQLRYDVTRERAGPLTRKHAVGFKVSDLPFRVLSVDILIESVGWVEVVAQVRTRSLYNGLPAAAYEEKEERAAMREAKMEALGKRKEKEKYSLRFKGDGPWHPVFAGEPKDPWAALEQIGGQGGKVKKILAKKENASVWDEIEGKDSTEKGENDVGEKMEEEEMLRDEYEDLPEARWPVVEVWSPNGMYVGVRRPMNGWLLNKPLVKKEHLRGRPRKSMKGHKKKMKALLKIAKQTAFTG